MDNIMTTYNAVLDTQTSAGVSIAAACKTNGVGRTTFYRTKCVAELEIVDETRFSNLQAGAKNLTELNKLCKTVLSATLLNKVMEMRRDGRLLRN
jgi:hypothetical protein